MAREVGGVRLGLALGSGAALGLAHIGLLKVLERENISVDMVAGSSIGALIGALWCSGLSAAEVEKIAMKFRPKYVTFMLFAADLAPIPKFGFIAGKRVVRLLQRYLKDKTFRDLKTPLKVTACEYANRQLRVFDEGSLVDAVRASVSIPAIFVPHTVDGRQMIDGGILDPVPVDVLLKSGVNKIVAVNALPSPEDIHRRNQEVKEDEARRAAQAREKGKFSHTWYHMRKRIAEGVEPKIFDVIMHSMQAMEYVLAEQACQQADIAMHPTIPVVNWYQFYSVGDLIERGEQEAERMLPQIRELIKT
tara:strand:- start:336 stop:1253 length:918 start_codon:yes stop_codon:yes gene_type:complete